MRRIRVVVAVLVVACCSLDVEGRTRYYVRRKIPRIRRLGLYDDGFEYSDKKSGDRGDVYEYHKFQHYGFKTKKPSLYDIGKALAILAPLAILPFFANAAMGGFTTTMAPFVGPLVDASSGRRKRDVFIDALGSSPNATVAVASLKHTIRRDLRDLDVIQKYLQQAKPRPDYNDEVMATYLQCSGMLGSNNHCLERLTCQFSDPSSPLSELEKDVSSLIIYTIFNNRYIQAEFKDRLRTAAIYARDSPGRCGTYPCSSRDYSSYRT